MKYSTYTWDLVKALESVSPASCKTPVTFIDSIRHKQLTKKKQKNGKMRFNFQEMVLHCLVLCTQNPGLRQVDLELTPKRGSHKINMLK